MKNINSSIFLTFLFFKVLYVFGSENKDCTDENCFEGVGELESSLSDTGSEIENDDLIFVVYPHQNAIIDCSGVKNLENKICWHGENFEVEGNSYKFKTFDAKLLIQSTNETDIEYYRSRCGKKPHSLRLFSN